MRTLVIMALLGYGGYYVYKSSHECGSEACAAYKTFAEAWAWGRYGEAKGASDGPALALVEQELAPPPPRPAGGAGSMAIIGHAMNANTMKSWGRDMVNDMAGSIDRITYDKQSEKKTRNKVSLVVVQSVRRTGTSATRGMPVNKFLHKVELQRQGTAWKVYSFEEQLVKK